LGRVILSEVLVVVGVHNRLVRSVGGETLSIGLTIAEVVSAAIGGKVRRFVDDGSSLRVGTSVGCAPEGIAEIDLAEAIESTSKLVNWQSKRSQEKA
jgi:hypothetical protein